MKLKTLSVLSMLAMGANVMAATPVHPKAPADPGVINHERIIYWMTKRGELPVNATEEQKALALKAYIGKKSFEHAKLPGEFAAKVRAAEFLVPQSELKHKHSLHKASAAIEKAQKDNQDVTVKVLALLVDFPDLKYNENRLSSSDTAMYYDDYSVEHYNSMLFNTNGYEGPSGQTLETSHQFYQQESGGSFFFTGQAHGWVTLEKDAAEYGGNDDDDDDKAPRELVKEAIAKAVAELNLDLSEYDKSDFFDIDGDGNIFEPDGIIDHVMIFHSSVGEEAGGGVLGADAIWSHRWFVDSQPVDVPGSDIKLFGYTINPIDAAIGVTVHEFGHDLGLPDLYDTAGGDISSPVSDWSVMASGSWNGSPPGSRPTGFSPYGRDYLAQRYGGNWMNQQVINFTDLESESINLVEAVNHDTGINQVKVVLPPSKEAFPAYDGQYMYYSGSGDKMDNRASFSIDLPAEAATLSMKARWDIEVDYDYAQILVNGEAVAGNHTVPTANQYYPTVSNYLTGKSGEIDGAEGDLGWVDLTFDLSAYAGQNVTIEFAYITDDYVGGYGLVIDKIDVSAGEQSVFSDNAEGLVSLTLNGFKHQINEMELAGHHYYMQLRSHKGVDSDLKNSKFDEGVVVWYRDEAVSNNQVNNHPGKVFLGVVDADQNPIKSGSSVRNTGTQIRDAAFSIYDQSTFNGDNHLTAVSSFDDKRDYSAPYQPASGIVLPKLGVKMTVDAQAPDSSTASITLSNTGADTIEAVRNGREITLTLNSAGLVQNSTVSWSLGDGTQLTGETVNHTYASVGEFDITVSYENEKGNVELSKSVQIAEAITGTITPQTTGNTVTFMADLSGGEGDYYYQWNFGDNSETSTLASPTHTYSELGEYTVTLTVMDETYVSYEVTLDFTLEALPLDATIDHTTSNLRANFTPVINGGDGSYTYAWDFGDGTTSTSQSPSHDYSAGGTYTVTLTVTDGAGETVTATTSVTVTAPVVTPPPTPTNNGGSGGGSLGIVSLFALLLLARRRQS